MRMIVEVPGYTSASGVQLDWDHGFELSVRVVRNEVILTGNSAGLRSFARHLLTLAQDGVPAGAHVHFDDSNSLEDGSSALIVERTD